MNKKLIYSFLMVCIAMASVSSAAQAEWYDKEHWQLRLRGISVTPNESGTASSGGSVSIDSAVVPELDITYFFNENIALELILATAEHDVSTVGVAADLGSVWLLPPTLLAQYHFTNETNFVPYVGAGINYTMFYNEEAPGAVSPIDYDDTFGYALQVGVDYKLDEHWLLNFDVKKLFISTDVSVAGGAVTANDVNIDPWIIGFGVGYRF